jgi:sodium-dependent dicarboxylate transporter 2/3/5
MRPTAQPAHDGEVISTCGDDTSQTHGGHPCEEEEAPPAVRRIGFYAGLALFAVLLLMPTPESMRAAVRERFATVLKADTEALLRRSGEASVSAETAAYQRAYGEAVDARARVMLAAAAVTALVACWWVTVALPIAVTSLMPLTLFPIVGVMSVEDAAAPYANSNVFLFMGGFIIAMGVERWGLHRRVALHIVRLIGTSRPNIVLGFMIATAAISMWISNTAATLMMLPIGLAIVRAVGELGGDAGSRQHANFSAALMIGIAYAAGIGGLGTPIGTPPNLVFRGQMAKLFPEHAEVGFGQWMVMFVPLIAVMLPLTWLLLVRITCPVKGGQLAAGREVIAGELRRLGPMSRQELVMLVVFLATALLWTGRSIPVGDANYGWSGWLELMLTPAAGPTRLFRARYIDDATVALVMAALLFVFPAGRNKDGSRVRLMDWRTAERLPWGILLLFGGGFCIAAGFMASGLGSWCGQVFAGAGIHSPLLLVLVVCGLVTFLSEISSNTALAQLMLPVLAEVSRKLGLDPLMLMLPCTISASFGFMLPVATPPNAIVFGSGLIKMRQMVRSGFLLDILGVILLTGFFYLLVAPLLGIRL